MGLDEAAMIVAGIGFRRGAEASEIAALIQRALSEAGIAPGRLAAIATADDRAGDAALHEAASGFGLVPQGIAPDALLACDARVPTRSARIEALRGVGSLCEAAALACAGPESRLVLDRIASSSVTCALAFRPETRQRAEG